MYSTRTFRLLGMYVSLKSSRMSSETRGGQISLDRSFRTNDTEPIRQGLQGTKNSFPTNKHELSTNPTCRREGSR